MKTQRPEVGLVSENKRFGLKKKNHDKKENNHLFSSKTRAVFTYCPVQFLINGDYLIKDRQPRRPPPHSHNYITLFIFYV